MNRSIRTTILAAALGLTLAACGNSSASGDGSADGGGSDGVTIVTTEFAFSPADFSVPADTATDIVLDNGKGVVEHDITVEELDLHIHADAGATTTQSVTLPAGTYTFYCSVPGHRAGGMEGTLTVG